jgi:hypothetical protein
MKFVSHLQNKNVLEISDTKNANAGDVHISGHKCPWGARIRIKRY